MTKKKMLLIFNPKSGLQKFPPQLFEVINKFTAAGFFVTAYPTQSAGEIKNLIADCAKDYDIVVCSGGDGTVSEAIDAIIALEYRPTFGIIPSGTVNDFSTSAGISKNITAAADIIINGVKKPLDIGRFGQTHFSYVAAFGLFTDVSYATPQNAKNILGSLAYYLEAVKRISSVKSFKCEFIVDGEAVCGDFVLGIIANSHSVAGMKIPKSMAVCMDDGLFEMILLKRPDSLKELQDVVASMLTQDFKSDLFVVRKAKCVKFSSRTPVAWTLDGDYGGKHTQAVIENHRHAIDVMVPSSSQPHQKTQINNLSHE